MEGATGRRTVTDCFSPGIGINVVSFIAAPIKIVCTMAETYAVSAADIAAARKRIAPYIHCTPVMRSRTLDSFAVGIELFFKCEIFQRGGAFKYRGALNSVLLLKVRCTPSTHFIQLLFLIVSFISFYFSPFLRTRMYKKAS